MNIAHVVTKKDARTLQRLSDTLVDMLASMEGATVRRKRRKKPAARRKSTPKADPKPKVTKAALRAAKAKVAKLAQAVDEEE